MKVLRSLSLMRKISDAAKCKGKRVGFVATMGALHQGHLSLIRKARCENDLVVVSIFVNPTQFGPKEDFKKYPRALKCDIALCQKEKVDIIFKPSAKDMYPEGFKTYINVRDLSNVLCGKSRLGHFQGVSTVVAKLFNIVNPDVAYFGQKDAQQSVILKKMCEELNFPIKIKIMPTVREKDGLAMSSRNVYLSKSERKDALILVSALKLAKGMVRKGIKDTDKIIRAMQQLILAKGNTKIDYVSVVDNKNLGPVKKVSSNCLIALAVWIGKTRLIDNIVLRP